MNIDIYRINLFKKKLRSVLGAPGARFYFSKGKCHICLNASHFGRENIPIAIQRLKKNRIDFKLDNWADWGLGNEIRAINIPIDQVALPERIRG